MDRHAPALIENMRDAAAGLKSRGQCGAQLACRAPPWLESRDRHFNVVFYEALEAGKGSVGTNSPSTRSSRAPRAAAQRARSV